jgi:hypothetical protein
MAREEWIVQLLVMRLPFVTVRPPPQLAQPPAAMPPLSTVKRPPRIRPAHTVAPAHVHSDIVEVSTAFTLLDLLVLADVVDELERTDTPSVPPD